MGKFSLENLFGMTIRESATDGSDFTNPDADYRRLFLGEDGLLHVKDSAGTVTSPYSSGSGIAVTGCKAYHSTTQSITGGTTASLSLDSEEFDTATYHDTSSNNTRLTVPATGLYAYGGSAYNAGNADEMELWVRKNGTTDLRGGSLIIGSVDGNQAHFSSIASLTAADYIEARCFLKTTANVGNASASLATEFWIYRLT